MKSQHLGLLLVIGGALAAPAPVPEEQAMQASQPAPQMAQGQMAQELSLEQKTLLTELSAQFPQLNALLGPILGGGGGGLLGRLPLVGSILATLPLHIILENLPILGPLLSTVLSPLIGPSTTTPTPTPGTGGTGGSGITVPGLGITLPFPLSVTETQSEAGANGGPVVAKRDANARQAAMAALSQMVIETENQVQRIQQIIQDSSNGGAAAAEAANNANANADGNSNANADPEQLISALIEPMTTLNNNLQAGVSRLAQIGLPGGLGGLLGGAGGGLGGGLGGLLGGDSSPLGLVSQLLDTVLRLVQSLLGGGGPTGGQTGLGQLVGGGVLNGVIGQSGLGSLLGGLLIGGNSPLAPLINQILGTVTGLLPGGGGASTAASTTSTQVTRS